MAQSYIRKQTLNFEGLPPLEVRELFVAEQELLAEGQNGKAFRNVVLNADTKEPFFADDEAFSKFPFRIANELANVVAALSDIEAADDEGKL
jgi:hypothetical protein